MISKALMTLEKVAPASMEKYFFRTIISLLLSSQSCDIVANQAEVGSLRLAGNLPIASYCANALLS